LIVIPALTPLAQGFWFVHAWRVIDTMPWPGPHYLLQGLWVGAALVVLATGLELLLGSVIPRRVLSP
jgi:hypothetical protein